MSTLQLLIICLTVLCVVVVLAPEHRRARGSFATPGSRVSVHTRLPDDRTITGLLADQHPDRLELVDASYVTEQGSTPIPGGTVVVPASSVSWLQHHADPVQEG